MTDDNKFSPVLLPSWPATSGDNCISWSSDDELAVAAGSEFVYVLTPTKNSSNAGHSRRRRRWHIANVQVNLFNPRAEWPDDEQLQRQGSLAVSITDFSIGEEQSTSDAVAVGWSGVGLGRYRGSVLAVLTSNLLLSFWETDTDADDGPTTSSSDWQRTCVVNHYLATLDAKQDQKYHRRRARRIRSFAWLPPLKRTSSASKWGIHYLAVATDNDRIVVLRVHSRFDVGADNDTKNHEGLASSQKRRWKFETALVLGLNDLEAIDPSIDTTSMSPLQLRLHQQAAISKIQLTPWSERGSLPIQHLTRVTITKGDTLYSTVISASDLSDGERASLKTIPEGVQEDRLAMVADTIYPPEEYFKDEVQHLRDEFDKTYHLSGHCRVRYWGSIMSPDSTRAVACVTVHPSDMIEYTIPSAEKCTLVFKETGLGSVESLAVLKKSEETVRGEILEFAHDTVMKTTSGNVIVDSLSLFDQKLCYAYANLASATLSSNSPVRNFFKNSLMVPDGLEVCEICGSSIASTINTTEADCVSGHQFTRCQLSFLAIQEPGISKYCSGCGMQFLDLAKVKLGPASKPSVLARAMFDEYDVCPYCRAKFSSQRVKNR